MLRKTSWGYAVRTPHLRVDMHVHDPAEAERRKLDVKMLLRIGAKDMPEDWRKSLGNALSLADSNRAWRELVDSVRKRLCPTPAVDRLLDA